MLKLATIDTFIIILMFALLPIDMINGIVLMKGMVLPISIGQFYKIIIIIFLLIRFFFTIRLLISTIILIFLLSISSMYQIIFNLEGSDILLDLIKATKYITPFICFLFFVNAFKYSRDKIYPLTLSLVRISYLILVLNIFTKYIGLGYPAYKNGGMGSKGFFFAGNEISALLIILCSIIAFQLWNKKQKIKYSIFLIINLLAALTISSKTAILGIILVFLIIPFQDKSLKLKKFIPLLGCSIVLLPLTLLFSWQFIKNTAIIIRIEYFYRELDFWTFLLSSRNVFLENSYYIFKNNYNLIEKVIGVGPSKFEYLNDFKVVEMDIMDIFFTYGFLGLIIFISLIAFILLQANAFSKSGRYPYSKLVSMMVIILLVVSTLAGHVFGSGMSAAFIGLLFALMYIKEPKNIDKTKLI